MTEYKERDMKFKDGSRLIAQNKSGSSNNIKIYSNPLKMEWQVLSDRNKNQVTDFHMKPRNFPLKTNFNIMKFIHYLFIYGINE